MGTLTETIDLKRYGRLLAKAAPRVITTAAERDRAEHMVESLLEKGERGMTPEADALLDLLANLIRDYEATAYPPRKKSSPREMLAFLMEQRGLRQRDVWPVVGSKSRTSEILAGARSPSKAQAKKLAEFFRVSVDLFL